VVFWGLIGTIAIVGAIIPLEIHSESSEAIKFHEEQTKILVETNKLKDDSSVEKIKESIVTFAYKYGVEKSSLITTLKCESGFSNYARGKAGEIGLAQYMPSTWSYFNKIRGTNLDIYNIEDQIDMTAWAFSKGLNNHWTCWKMYFTT
jgi:soluble lytic murein transglycosylase-like protein